MTHAWVVCVGDADQFQGDAVIFNRGGKDESKMREKLGPDFGRRLDEAIEDVGDNTTTPVIVKTYSKPEFCIVTGTPTIMEAEIAEDLHRTKTLEDYILSSCIHRARITEGCKKTETAQHNPGYVHNLAASLPEAAKESPYMCPKDRIVSTIQTITRSWPHGLERITLILPDEEAADMTFKMIEEIEGQVTARFRTSAQEETKQRLQLDKQTENRRINLQLQNGNTTADADNEVLTLEDEVAEPLTWREQRRAEKVSQDEPPPPPRPTQNNVGPAGKTPQPPQCPYKMGRTT